MKTLRNTLLSLGMTASAALAQAAGVVLDFEGLANLDPVGNFYNGGGGTNYGISFSPSTLALIDADAGFGNTGDFANEPSPSTVMFFLDDDNAYLNYAAGFTESVSFFYSSQSSAVVNIFDGLNGAGNILASIALTDQFDSGCSGDPNGLFCNFSPVGASFSGIAKSINFGGAANRTAFDNITLGALIPGEGGGNDIPEPATLALLSLALAGVGLYSRPNAQSISKAAFQ